MAQGLRAHSALQESAPRSGLHDRQFKVPSGFNERYTLSLRQFLICSPFAEPFWQISVSKIFTLLFITVAKLQS